MGETPSVQVSTIWALTYPETVHQRPCMTREIETWLSDSRVGNNSVVDNKTLRQQNPPVLNWRCRLTQVDLYNGRKTVVVVVNAPETVASI